MYGLDRLVFMLTVAIVGYNADETSNTYEERTILGRGKSCRVNSEQGTCMFQWQCRSQGGTSMSPCLNGILFGTCCRIPDGKQDHSASSNLMVSDHNKPSSSHQPSSSKLPQRIYALQTTSEIMNRPTPAFGTRITTSVPKTEAPVTTRTTPVTSTTERTTVSPSNWWKETTSLPQSTITHSALDRTSDHFQFSFESDIDASTKRTSPAVGLHSSVLTTIIESLSDPHSNDFTWQNRPTTVQPEKAPISQTVNDAVHINTIDTESVTHASVFQIPPMMKIPAFPVNIPSFGDFHTNPPGETDDFPLGAIQQIISDFANESTPFPWFVNPGITPPPSQPAWNTQNTASTITREETVTQTTPSMSTLLHKDPTILFPPTPGPIEHTTVHNFMSGVIAIGASDAASVAAHIPPKPPPFISVHVVNSTSSSVDINEDTMNHEVAYGDDPVTTSAPLEQPPHSSEHSTTIGSTTTEANAPEVSSTTVRVPWTTTVHVQQVITSTNPPVVRLTTLSTTTEKVTTAINKDVPVPTSTTKRPITRRPTRRTTTTKPQTTTRRPWNYKKDCGVRPLAPRGRIVGGKKAYFGQWPWQALVKEATWFGLVVKTKCGGVLINNKYVLTAAHCQPGWLASLLVLLGEYDLTSENEQYKPLQRNVRRVVTHRDFNPSTFENDLALLELDKVIDFQPHIVPICLPTAQEQSSLISKSAVVSGWGRLTTGGSLPSVLHYVQVPILANNVCQEMFRKAGQVKNIRDSFVCAGYAVGGKDSCEGDSGGPLTLQRNDSRWELIGIVSHGIKCAYPNLPGVYTRISYFLDWIGKLV